MKIIDNKTHEQNNVEHTIQRKEKSKYEHNWD